MAQDKTHLLIVDDEPMVVYTLKCILEQVGYQVSEAATLEEALMIVRSKKTKVMICDLALRGGISGVQVIAEAAKIQPEMTAIVLTGYADPGEIEKLEDQGLPVFFKPVEMSRLLSELRRHCERKAA